MLILMRWREGKPGGGKGALLSENKSLTLATANDQVLFLFEANRRDGIRIHDGISPTLQAYIGTGGNNMPMIADCYPIDTRNALRDPEKKDSMNRQGLGVGADGDESPTLTDVFIPAVAYSIREDAVANNFSATPIETTPALQALQPSVQSHHAQTFIAQEIPVNETVVRRLTPIECERLQGFPDDWTAQRIDHKTGNVIEQKDSARYKQMGNAVAVPCVEWLLGRIIHALRTE